MANIQITTALLGIGLPSLILVLLRRDRLHPLYGLFWMVMALLAVVLGLWPGSISYVAQVSGITYPPSPLLVAVIVLLLKSLYVDIINTRIERQGRRSNQRLEMFELGRDGDKAP